MILGERKILGESALLRPSILQPVTSNENIQLSPESRTLIAASPSSGLARDFSKVLTRLVDEEDNEKPVQYTRTDKDGLNITEMLGMMLRKEEKCRKRSKPSTPLPKIKEFPKHYSPSYRGRISVWLREFCKDYKLSMTVFFKASQFLDQFLQQKNLWKKYLSTKVTDEDMYAVSLVALMIASKFDSMTVAVDQIARLTGRPIQTIVLMECDMLSLAVNPGFEDSSFAFNAVTYNEFIWPSIREGLENRLGQEMDTKYADVNKNIFRRKIDFALHRALLDRNGIAGVRSSLIAIAAIDAIMLDAGLKTDQRLWKLFKYDRNQPYIKKVNNMMLEALQNKDYCDIFSTYEKRWTAEDIMMRKMALHKKEVTTN